MFNVKFYSHDLMRMLDVINIDFLNDKFAVICDGRKTTLDGVEQLLLDTGEKLITFSEFSEFKET